MKRPTVLLLLVGTLLALATLPMGATAAPKKPKSVIFHSIKNIPDPTARSQKLKRIVRQHKRKQPRYWHHWKRRLKAYGGSSLLQAVNNLVNKQVNYVDDVKNRWQSPIDTFTKGGDCEDVAIAKMFMLLELGFPGEDMRIVTLAPDRPRVPYHVVLIARTWDNVYILDSSLRYKKKFYPLKKYPGLRRRVVWSGWLGGFFTPSGTLAKEPKGHFSSVSRDQILIEIATDIRVLKPGEAALSKKEIKKLKQLRAFFRKPSSATRKPLTALEAKEILHIRSIFWDIPS